MLSRTPPVPTEGCWQTIKFNPLDISEDGPAKLTLGVDHAYLAGVFLGDGSISGHSVSIAVGAPAGYAPWKKTLMDLGAALQLPVVEHTKLIYLGSRPSVALLRRLGVADTGDFRGRSRKKLRIPQWVFDSPHALRFAFIAGLMDTDGCVGKNGDSTICTKDAIFASEIATLARSTGFEAYLCESYNRTYDRYYYKVRLRRPLMLEVVRYMRFENKITRFTSFCERTKSNPRTIRDNLVLLVEDAGTVPLVDLCVDSPEHTYIANNLATHNTILFGLLYGRGATAIAAQIGKSVAEARKIIDDWFAGAPEVAQWIDYIHKVAVRDNAVVSLLGRIRWLDEFFADPDDSGKIEEGYRRAVNTPIQGLAADLCTLAAARITYRLQQEGFRSLVILTVYDSVIIDVYPGELDRVYSVVAYEMTDAVGKLFPFVSLRMETDIEVGINWGKLVSVSMQDGCVALKSSDPVRLGAITQSLLSHSSYSLSSALKPVFRDGKLARVEVGLRPRSVSIAQ